MRWHEDLAKKIRNNYPNALKNQKYPELLITKQDKDHFLFEIDEKISSKYTLYATNDVEKKNQHHMRSWVFPYNTNNYNLDEKVFKENIIEYPQQVINCKNKEIIYFYSVLEKIIKYKGVVTNKNDNILSIKITGYTKNNSLSLNLLKEYGLNQFDKPINKVSYALQEFIDKNIIQISNTPNSENNNNEKLKEGSYETIKVNKYERNNLARAKCIEYYGTKCQVCGMEFKSTYGNFAAGFIHVHHKIPLSEIKEEYYVDPINDLIPVCPNCHAMLHHYNQNGKCYTIDELKKIVITNDYT